MWCVGETLFIIFYLKNTGTPLKSYLIHITQKFGTRMKIWLIWTTAQLIPPPGITRRIILMWVQNRNPGRNTRFKPSIQIYHHLVSIPNFPNGGGVPIPRESYPSTAIVHRRAGPLFWQILDPKLMRIGDCQQYDEKKRAEKEKGLKKTTER